MVRTILIIASIFLSTTILKSQDLNKPILDSIVSLSKKSNSNALIVYKGNKLVYKNYFGNPEKKIEAMSTTKSIASIAILLLLEQDLIDSLNQPVYTIYPEWKQGNKSLITIKHLLEHTSGIQNLPNAGVEVENSPDVIQLALSAELETIPGFEFSYNNKACNLIAGIVEKKSGMKLDKFLEKHLFKKLGISDYSWRADPSGNPLAMAGLQIYPEDLVKIGLLLLNGGKWNENQIIDHKLISKMFVPSKLNETYGLQWWLTYENKNYIIDDDFLNTVKPKADENTLLLIEKLKGRYQSLADIRQKAMNIYSKDNLIAVGKLLQSVPEKKWKIENSGKIMNYAAVGYLGQYLIIVPEKKLVLVRMIDAGNFKEIHNNRQDLNLQALVNEL